MDRTQLPTQFGIFYPTGWIVVALQDRAAADQVQRDLFAGGYGEQDCILFEAKDVIPSANAQLENSDRLARLGRADEAVQAHLQAEQGGSTFLLVFAPTDDEADRVMNVVRRVPFQFVHRYRRFAIETLK